MLVHEFFLSICCYQSYRAIKANRIVVSQQYFKNRFKLIGLEFFPALKFMEQNLYILIPKSFQILYSR